MTASSDIIHTIVSIASEEWIASTICDEIIPHLKSNVTTIKHVGISLEKWYGGTASAIYEKKCDKSYIIPRIGNDEMIWWQDPNIVGKYFNSVTLIIDQINAIINSNQPQILILADDTGPIETLIIKIFNSAGIPVILLEHGYGDIRPISQISKFEEKKLYNLRNISRSTIRHYLKSKYYQYITKIPFSIPLYANPFGFNGKCLICTYSIYTKNRLLKRGIPADRIYETGFPYWDKVYRESLKYSKCKHKNNKIKKILFVSSGLSKFSYYDINKEFYKSVINVAKKLVGKHKIYLRTKPGEVLLKNSLAQLNKLNMIFVSNKIPTYKQIQDFDLIIGNNTTVILESSAIGIPTLYLKYLKEELPDYYYSEILGKYLKVNHFQSNDNINLLIKRYANNAYGKYLAKNFIKNANIIINGFDGLTGERVSSVIKRFLLDSNFANREKLS